MFFLYPKILPKRYFDQTQNAFPTAYVAYPSTSSYPYQQSQQYSGSYNSSYGNSYSQAVSDYATNQYYQQYQQSPISNKSQSNLKWNTKRKSAPYGKPPGVSQQLYCEICKVSCAGEQSYKDHCDGQKHKKKELLLNTAAKPAKAKPGSAFFCDLCQVPCSGVDAFNAHLNGKSHIKVCNLQVKMGKEVPTNLVAPILNRPATGQSLQSVESNPAAQQKIKVIGTPAINFVKGECLNTMANCEINSKETETVPTETDQMPDSGEQTNDSTQPVDTAAPVDESLTEQQDTSNLNSFMDDQNSAANQSNAEPVGLEFVFEYSQPNSKATFFSCTLCNCKFIEFAAKEQHVRGKRHLKAFKLESKKKIPFNANQTAPASVPTASPSVIAPPLNISANLSNNTPNSNLFSSPLMSAPKMRRPPSFENLLPASARSNKKQRTQNDPCYNQNQNNVSLDNGDQVEPVAFQENIDIRSFIDCDFYETPHTSHDNRYLLRKHAEIVPREDDLKLFYRHIRNVERSLKLVSDDFLRDMDQLRETTNLPMTKDRRILEGEIRTGLFGKKLLLRDERQIDLILFCSMKPNVPLLKRVGEVLTEKLALIEDEKYEIVENIEMAAIDVRASNSTIRITLTSLYFRERNVPTVQNGEERFKDPEQMLDRQRCLDALTALRRFKWYLAKVGPYAPCPMIIRLLRDFTKRVPAWKPLTCWTLELICERVMSNCTNQPSPAEGFRFLLRTLASGALLSDSYDAMLILDPCEYEKTDALAYLTEQQRQEITDSAQDLVGLIAFNKIHQVLGVERIDFGLLTKKMTDNNGSTNENGNEKQISQAETDEQKSSYDIGISETTD